MDCHKDMVESIKSGDPDRVIDSIEQTRVNDLDNFEKNGLTLLNVAAASEINNKNEIITILVRHGFSKWNRCEAGTRFFIETLADYLKGPLDCKENEKLHTKM